MKLIIQKHRNQIPVGSKEVMADGGGTINKTMSGGTRMKMVTKSNCDSYGSCIILLRK